MSLDLSLVDELLTVLRDLPAVESADLDPVKVNRLPGVWVRIASIEDETYGGPDAIGLELHLAVADQDTKRAWANLQSLYNAVTAVLQPSGPTRAITLGLPDRASLPALVVPVTVP